MKKMFRLNREPYKGHGDMIEVFCEYNKGTGYCIRAIVFERKLVNGIPLDSFCVFLEAGKCNSYTELVEECSRRSAKKEQAVDQKIAESARGYAEKLIRKMEKYGVSGIEITEELAC